MSQAPPPYNYAQGQPGGQPAYPPGQPGYPPGQPGYPPGQPGYPPGQPGYPPGQPGYPPGQPVQGQPAAYQPGQQPPVVVAQPGQQAGTTVVVMGASCARCGRGPVSEEFTTCGIILAICCFPLGIICCLMMKERKCVSCGATF